MAKAVKSWEKHGSGSGGDPGEHPAKKWQRGREEKAPGGPRRRLKEVTVEMGQALATGMAASMTERVELPLKGKVMLLMVEVQELNELIGSTD